MIYNLSSPSPAAASRASVVVELPSNKIESSCSRGSIVVNGRDDNSSKLDGSEELHSAPELHYCPVKESGIFSLYT